MLIPTVAGLPFVEVGVTVKAAVKPTPDLTSCQPPLPLLSVGFHQESEPVPVMLPAPPVRTYFDTVPASCQLLVDHVIDPVYEPALALALSEKFTLPRPERLYQPPPAAVL